jgi:hypothetical protein
LEHNHVEHDDFEHDDFEHDDFEHDDFEHDDFEHDGCEHDGCEHDDNVAVSNDDDGEQQLDGRGGRPAVNTCCSTGICAAICFPD